MNKRLEQLIDWLISPRRFTNPRERYQARLLTCTLSGTAVLLAVFGAGQLCFAQLSPAAFWIVLFIHTPMCVISLGLLCALRFGMPAVMVLHAQLAASWLAIMVAVVLTGGGLHSPVIFTLLVPPVVAFRIAGTRGGLVWTAIVAVSEAALLLAHYWGMGHAVYSMSIPVNQMIYLWLFIFSMVVGFSLFNAHNTEALERELDRERDRLHYMATHDPLTGLANRHLFASALEQALYDCGRYRQSIALMFLDLDNFKQLNDRFGHEAGDAVLKAVSERLGAATRETDTVGRLGGDEFAVLIQNVCHETDIVAIADHLHRVVTEVVDWQDNHLSVAASIGISLAPRQAREAGLLCQLADRAMYRAKQGQQKWLIAGTVDIAAPTADMAVSAAL